MKLIYLHTSEAGNEALLKEQALNFLKLRNTDPRFRFQTRGTFKGEVFTYEEVVVYDASSKEKLAIFKYEFFEECFP